MDILFQKYFAKHPVQQQSVVESAIKVVVPVYLEEDDLPVLLDSLSNAQSKSRLEVELILVFNYSEQASETVKVRQHNLYSNIDALCENLPVSLRVTKLEDYNVPKKHAGVGHARKVGMDYAAWSYAQHGISNGLIISLDADCTVAENYFEQINEHTHSNALTGGTIYFEHPLNGALPDDVYEAIAEYELHLRYYVKALRYAGFPYAFHTVGSCFFVTAEAYIKAGGMPRKQAGEDFYFLQKVIPQGHFSEVNVTEVYPSARPSDRVPFGTGPSINEQLHSGMEYQTYNLQAFIDLKEFLDIKDDLYKLSQDDIDEFTHRLRGRMRSYLVNSDFFTALKPINDNCASLDVFRKRFYEVFNAFRVVKYLNYTHTHFLEKMPVFDAALNLLEQGFEQSADVFETKELLQEYRLMEQKQTYSI
ncbi:glycosyltransferase family 2 protein [Carboxylicivirga mesophila]|uniref:Glycosyltransferase family 2 protein n=1 Tax=Carboxylicivirga mesophila TaxID=1166478 RepID=A0ABS5K6A7_9BACT|nr:glycosyltransferase family A protein [Carboxylicivirga mesophila]MBS2210491.1 glycosyltransferase family 2 protein [Carboxylicivirga mesophila]